MPELKKINNNLKSYINEATGISDKCKNKLIKLVEKHFLVSLPHDNYKNIDIEILKSGNVKMRDVEYETKETPTEEELLERYNSFSEEVDELLEKKATNFDKKKTSTNIINIFILLLYLIFTVIIGMYGIKQLIIGNITGVLYLIFLLSYYIIPISGGKIRSRIEMAKRYIKNLLK